jgi:signal transduction histidine kinase
MMLSDNAASMGRLAAALSHELNNPLGILKSNLDTLRGFLWGKKDLSTKKQETLSRLGEELCHDSMESVDRLQSTIERMQRFTNLDRAEILPVDLNAMLRDVAEIVADSLDKPVRFEFALRPLPYVSLRPQLMSAVFSALMQNAAEATPSGLPVRVSSGLEGTTVAVRIEDQGPGIPADQLEATFDPALQVRGNRVAACNWSMFSARQTVRQHGGEIRLEGGSGTGARVVVMLPAQLMNG